MDTRSKTIEAIEELITRIVSRSAAGQELVLVGGFRYRLLDGSARFSADVDFHYSGNLSEKQHALLALFRLKLLPEVKRQLGYDGSADIAIDREDSSIVKTIDLAFYTLAPSAIRIELPVDITGIVCADPYEVRTRSGVVYLTASDADMIESKLLAVVLRPVCAVRDLLDLFFFSNHFRGDSPVRFKEKCRQLALGSDTIQRRVTALHTNKNHYINSLNSLIETTVEESVAETIARGGGASVVFDTALACISHQFSPGPGGSL